MGIKNLEDTTHDIEVAKEVLDSMPINNAKNLALYKKKVAELKEEYSGYANELLGEIKRRSSKYLNAKPSDRLELVKKELQDYQDIDLFSPVNTPFEKMGFDTLLYSLTHYYKNDLASVNAEIKEVFRRFELVGVKLTEEDFIYSNYARKYIKELLKDDDLERMKDVFEDLHWKCPDVISHVETSFRILYNRFVKSFENYIDDKQHEIVLDSFSFDDYLMKRNNLAKELEEIEKYDEAILIQKFMNGELMLNDYNVVNISRCYAKFMGDNPDLAKGRAKVEDFKNLAFNLREYQGYLKFQFVLDDIKKKYAEKDSHVGDAAKLRKEISELIAELTKLTSEINSGNTKGFLFFKKKVDIEKNYLEVNEKVKELDAKYEEYDNAIIYEKLNEYITETSTIFDVFKFVLSYKGYLRSCIKSLDDSIDINKVKETVKEFDEFLSDPYLNVITSSPFNVDANLALIIMDHYKLLELNVNYDDMTIEGIDGLLKELEVCINDAYLTKYELSNEFILDLFESKKILDNIK